MTLFAPTSAWQKLQAWLFTPKENLLEFLIFRAALILFFKIVFFIGLLLLEQSSDIFSAHAQQLSKAAKRDFGWSDTVIIAPFLESLMILILLKLGASLRLRIWANCTLCAFLMALLHVPSWGWLKPLPTFIPFSLFASAYLAYYQRSRILAFAMCTGLHVLNNGFGIM